jgi:hypothetical protein
MNPTATVPDARTLTAFMDVLNEIEQATDPDTDQPHHLRRRQALPAHTTSSLIDTDDTDVILRSADGIDFRAHKCILGLSSPFWEDMFSLPQALAAGAALPVVDMAEDSEALEGLLRLVYPIADPPLHVWEDAVAVHAAAEKYDMSEAAALCVRRICAFGDKDAVRTFAYGYARRLPDVVRAGARGYLRCPMLPSTDEPLGALKELPLVPFLRLLQCHRDCQARVAVLTFPQYCLPRGVPTLVGHGATAAVKWDRGLPVWFECKKCPTDKKYKMQDGPRVYYARSWWSSYMGMLAGALERAPHPSSVLDPNILEPTWYNSSNCVLCASPVGRAQFDAVNQYISREVKERTDHILVSCILISPCFRSVSYWLSPQDKLNVYS